MYSRGVEVYVNEERVDVRTICTAEDVEVYVNEEPVNDLAS
jgi:hypothetical protein